MYILLIKREEGSQCLFILKPLNVRNMDKNQKVSLIFFSQECKSESGDKRSGILNQFLNEKKKEKRESLKPNLRQLKATHKYRTT